MPGMIVQQLQSSKPQDLHTAPLVGASAQPPGRPELQATDTGNQHVLHPSYTDTKQDSHHDWHRANHTTTSIHTPLTPPHAYLLIRKQAATAAHMHGTPTTGLCDKQATALTLSHT